MFSPCLVRAHFELLGFHSIHLLASAAMPYAITTADKSGNRHAGERQQQRISPCFGAAAGCILLLTD